MPAAAVTLRTPRSVVARGADSNTDSDSEYDADDSKKGKTPSPGGDSDGDEDMSLWQQPAPGVPVRVPAGLRGALVALAGADIKAARALLFANGSGAPLPPAAFAEAVDSVATAAVADAALAAAADAAARNAGPAVGAALIAAPGLVRGGSLQRLLVLRRQLSGSSDTGSTFTVGRGGSAGLATAATRSQLFTGARFVRLTFATRSAFLCAALAAATGAGASLNADAGASPALGPAVAVPGAHATLVPVPVARSLAALGLCLRAGSSAAGSASGALGAVVAALREGLATVVPDAATAAATAHLKRSPFATLWGRGGLGAAAAAPAVTALASGPGGSGCADPPLGPVSAAAACSLACAPFAASWPLALRPPREWWSLLAGSAELDLDALRQRTVIVGTDGVRCALGAVAATFVAAGPPLAPREVAVADALWAVLAGWGARERAAFLQFVWGMSRLPAQSGSSEQCMRVQLTDWPDCDARLPQSHTCFMVLELPCYSSVEVMRRRLLIAIACQEITA
jgi:hypothetical protein